MSAPAQSPVRWYPLPEYEPPLLTVPPDPDEPPDPDDPVTPWYPPRPAPDPPLRLPVPWPPGDCPVWDEPGEVRDQMRRLLGMTLEVLDGRRPIGQLRGAVTAHVFESLLTRSQHTASAGRQHRLRTLHTCRPAPGVLELCGILAISSPGTRRPMIITVVARMEHRRGHWLCTFLRPLYPNRT